MLLMWCTGSVFSCDESLQVCNAKYSRNRCIYIEVFGMDGYLSSSETVSVIPCFLYSGYQWTCVWISPCFQHQQSLYSQLFCCSHSSNYFRYGPHDVIAQFSYSAHNSSQWWCYAARIPEKPCTDGAERKYNAVLLVPMLVCTLLDHGISPMRG